MSYYDTELQARGLPHMSPPGIQFNWFYWPIELESLCDTPARLDPFTKIFLGSIARRVERALDLPAQGIRLTVIDMHFLDSRYPCIAAYTYERDSRGCSIIPEEMAVAIICELRSTFLRTELGGMLTQESREDAKPVQ